MWFAGQARDLTVRRDPPFRDLFYEREDFDRERRHFYFKFGAAALTDRANRFAIFHLISLHSLDVETQFPTPKRSGRLCRACH